MTFKQRSYQFSFQFYWHPAQLCSSQRAWSPALPLCPQGDTPVPMQPSFPQASALPSFSLTDSPLVDSGSHLSPCAAQGTRQVVTC